MLGLLTCEVLLERGEYSSGTEQVTGRLGDDRYRDPTAALAHGTIVSKASIGACKRNPFDEPISSRGPGHLRNAERLASEMLPAELATAQVFNKLVSNQVLSWLHLRNAAAHGNYAEYDKAAVEAMLRDLRSFLTSFPA